MLLGAGVLAGAMNGLAGGGSFVTLPALIAAGVPALQANASSTVALCPGGFASAWTYRGTLGPVRDIPVGTLLALTMTGGFAGSLLLLFTPVSLFDLVLPWLLLFATVTLAYGRKAGIVLQRHVRLGRGSLLAFQFVLGVYGGYFGGAVGLMMLAVWGLLGEVDIKALNAPRTLLVSAANAVASIIFIIAGAISWMQTLALLVGAIGGGALGARLGLMLPQAAIRLITVATTSAITLIFFIRAYG
jgi:uncharacterized membrane protein YfcA